MSFFDFHRFVDTVVSLMGSNNTTMGSLQDLNPLQYHLQTIILEPYRVGHATIKSNNMHICFFPMPDNNTIIPTAQKIVQSLEYHNMRNVKHIVSPSLFRDKIVLIVQTINNNHVTQNPGELEITNLLGNIQLS